ncbi:MAG: YqzE family protein [Sporolactobacillus sp.]
MKSEDYVRYLTEQFVRYMETPRDERKKVRREHKAVRPPMRNQLFGQIPDAIENYAQAIKNQIRNKRHK